MEQQTLEGTWEEILQHSAELLGQRVRLTILPHQSSQSPLVILSELPPKMEISPPASKLTEISLKFYSTNIMTQGKEPNDENREAQRQIRTLNRRVQRLEYSQITPQELAESFDRVYDEIDALEDIITERFDRLETELNGKIDTILSYITKLKEDSENR